MGGQLSEDQPGLNGAAIAGNTMIALQEGATILNYYVLFGGTNFGLWPGRGNTATYDYFAPIREPGGVGEKYLAVKAIGLMLQEHGAALARSRVLSCQAETGSAEVTVAARRARNGEVYLFFRNHSVPDAHRGSATVWLEGGTEIRLDYDLGPFGYKIFHLASALTDPAKGEWLPKPVTGPARPDHLPAPVRPVLAQMRADPGGSDWVRGRRRRHAAGELGVYDARPVVYAASLSLPASGAAPGAALRMDSYPGDALVAVEVNGRVVPCGTGREAVVGRWLRPGQNDLRIL